MCEALLGLLFTLIDFGLLAANRGHRGGKKRNKKKKKRKESARGNYEQPRTEMLQDATGGKGGTDREAETEGEDDDEDVDDDEEEVPSALTVHNTFMDVVVRWERNMLDCAVEEKNKPLLFSAVTEPTHNVGGQIFNIHEVK